MKKNTKKKKKRPVKVVAQRRKRLLRKRRAKAKTSFRIFFTKRARTDRLESALTFNRQARTEGALPDPRIEIVRQPNGGFLAVEVRGEKREPLQGKTFTRINNCRRDVIRRLALTLPMFSPTVLKKVRKIRRGHAQ